MLVLAVLHLGERAEAHTGGTTGYAKITVEGQTVRYSLTLGVDAVDAAQGPPGTPQGPLSTDPDALAGLVARHISVLADGQACAPLPGTVQPPMPGRSSIVIVVHYACAAPVRTLTLRDDLFVVLGRDHHTLANVEWAGGNEQILLDPDRPEARVALGGPTASAPATSPASTGAFGFFRLGIEHILEGFDHVLFIFALILRGGRVWSLLGIVTAFTVAHSLTLGLAVLGVVAPPTWIVEPLIAASIAYVAFENIFLERAVSRRWLVSFLFGLVHGFGFAGALIELGLPAGSLFSSLLSFNLGVEAGQAMIVGLLFPALLWLSRSRWEQRAVTVMSAVVLVVAIGLLVERVLLA
ncbi:HupE/UreJ family protein [Vineibacter terrae]|uniref:HupE/UreJ family protein n=1 Tax=Vineibacter terrae TaxID=2586908 RepID=UPI002E32D61C|nr:HupE/UreJ family protein [Vineibacter terrae]HEX2892285.1 HupE/UreJ family protein [Vineibacter terrae]